MFFWTESITEAARACRQLEMMGIRAHYVADGNRYAVIA